MTPEAPFPKAVTDAQGQFELTSFQPGDGAPAGNYVVTVVWRAGVADATTDPEMRDQQPDKLRGRFADPQSSPLKAEVLAKANELPPLELN